MKLFLRSLLAGLLPFAIAAAAQITPITQPTPDEPVSYASVSQLNTVLSRLEQGSQAAQLDLAKLRVEKWKTDGNTKRQTLQNVDSIQRNLQAALPGIINDLRSSPENLSATFKLYRNLEILYDVLRSVTESAGAFGNKDEFQALANDIGAFENSRRALADRMDSLSTTKDAELNRLRTQVRSLQASIPTAPPKKVVIDDTAPAKKPASKKKAAVPKPPATSAPKL